MRNSQQQQQLPKIMQSPRQNQNLTQFSNKSNSILAKSYYKDENEMTGFRQFQNGLQQTEINFNTSQQSQGTEIIIELSKKKQLNEKSKEQLFKFIESYYHEGNIKIIVTLPSILGEQLEKKTKENYKFLNMTMNQITISEEDKLLQQRIYQFKGQPENNIQPLIEMVIYSYNYFPYFKKQIQQDNGGQIVFNYEGFYFQIPPPQLRQVSVYDLDRHFDTFCQELENTMILQIECSSDAEALTKFNIIKNKEVYKLIEKYLNLIYIDVVILKLDSLTKQLGIKTNFQQLLKHDQLYCLIRKNGQSIEESQNKLNEFFKSKEIIKKVIMTDSFLFYDLPCNEDEIQIKIDKLRLQYPEIYIEISDCPGLEDKRLKLSITTTTFLFKDQNQTDFQNQTKKIKTQIEEIYLPYKNISITQKQKIIWECYLQEYFQKYQSCFTVHQKGETIEIALKTNQEKWRELEKQLNEKLHSYTCQNIKLEAKTLILKQLKNCQNKNKVFKQVFQKLLLDFENQVNVTIKEVDDRFVTFQVIYDKNNCDFKKIENILKTEFITNLNVKQENLLYEESLKYFKIQAPELIQNNNIFVHQEPQHQVYFIGLDQHLKEIKSFVFKLKEQYESAWVKLEFTVENKLIFNILHSKYMLKEIELKLGTTIEFMKATDTIYRKIIIHGFQNEVVNLLIKLSQLENKVKQYIKINIPEFNYQQIQQLIGKPKQLSQIEAQTSSYFEFQKIVSFQPQQAVLQKLTFEGKELSIVKGDITQIKCEAIVYQIQNDQCEFGEIGLQNQQVKNLLKMTNNHLQEYFKEIMKDKYSINPGDLFYYNVNTKCHIDHIFNIYPPTYRQAKTLVRDQKIIEQLVLKIFQMAKENNIQQIAFPIISAEIFGFYINMASQILLRSIIQCLYSEDCNVKQVFILENDDSRCKRLLYNLNQLVSDNSQQQRTENYLTQQWQWFEFDHYEDYDDYEVNRKICKMYTLFEKGQDQQFNILYPYSKYPGTHLIDLDQQKIWDKTHNNSEQTIISIDNFGERKYYIDGKQVTDDLNRYLIQQDIQGKRKFDIFYKFYEIHLTSRGHYQKNLQFGNIRPIQFIPYENPNMEYILGQEYSQLKFEKMIDDVNGSKSINFEKQVISDKMLIHTTNDDENIPEQKLLGLLQNQPLTRVTLSQDHLKTEQSSQNTEQIFQIRSPSNRRIAQTKREPLQQKN